MNVETFRRVAALKRRLKKGEPSFGSWITLGHPSVAEVMAQAGFEWLTVDLEHSAVGVGEAQGLIMAIEAQGAVPLVRVTNNDPNLIKRVMDAGAAGVIVPMVNTPEEAQRAVSAVRYPPQGSRGVGLARAQNYGFSFPEYAAQVNRNTVVVVQIEHIRAVENIEGILKTAGVDAFMVGPYDLSGSLGVPGHFEHPAVRRALARVHAAARQAGAVLGFHVIPPDPAETRRRLAEGFRFLALSLDTLFLGGGCRALLAGLQGPRRG